MSELVWVLLNNRVASSWILTIQVGYKENFLFRKSGEVLAQAARWGSGVTIPGGVKKTTNVEMWHWGTWLEGMVVGTGWGWTAWSYCFFPTLTILWYLKRLAVYSISFGFRCPILCEGAFKDILSLFFFLNWLPCRETWWGRPRASSVSCYGLVRLVALPPLKFKNENMLFCI